MKTINITKLHNEIKTRSDKSTTLQVIECLQNSDIYPEETFFVKTTHLKRKFIMSKFSDLSIMLDMECIKFRDDALYINKCNFKFIDNERGCNKDNTFYVD